MEYVYIVSCRDGTLYTGWTNNLTARLAAHNRGQGAKYTKGRGPVRLVYSEVFADRSQALRREAAIKKLTRSQKDDLIAQQMDGQPEVLDIMDADGRLCGVRPRTLVHKQGLRHAVVHLWVLEVRDGVPGLWMQRRALDRPLHPGRYDLSATGHISAGESPRQAVLREAYEECGLELSEQMLEQLPVTVNQRYARNDGGMDDEIARLFLWVRSDGIPFAPGQEVMELRWVTLQAFDNCLKAGQDLIWPDGSALPCTGLSCFHPEEWDVVRERLRETGFWNG